MFRMWLYFITIFFLIFPIALCDKRTSCELNDEACLTAAYKILFKKAVVGNSVYKIMGSDPLYRDKIEVILPHMNLTLNKAFMHGTKSCDAHSLRIKPEEWFASYICPKMVLESDYEMNGDVDSVHIEGNGRCEIVYENYSFGVRGGYETYTGENGKDYYNITYYKMDFIDVKGSVVYNFTNLYNGDKEKSVKVHHYINHDWNKLHNIIGEPILYSLFGQFIENLNKYLAVLPKFELFQKLL